MTNNTIENKLNEFYVKPIIMPERKIFVYDVTLRDGAQASGFHMFPDEKERIAYKLAEMGVDGIEAGFAFSSKGDFDSIWHFGVNGRFLVNDFPNLAKIIVEALERCLQTDSIQNETSQINKAQVIIDLKSIATWNNHSHIEITEMVSNILKRYENNRDPVKGNHSY